MSFGVQAAGEVVAAELVVGFTGGQDVPVALCRPSRRARALGVFPGGALQAPPGRPAGPEALVLGRVRGAVAVVLPRAGWRWGGGAGCGCPGRGWYRGGGRGARRRCWRRARG